jgi:hypothetical protein
MPEAPAQDMFALLHADLTEDVAPPVRAPEPQPESVDRLIAHITTSPLAEAEETALLTTTAAPAPDFNEALGAILDEMAQDEEAPFRPAAVTYQDFTVRCRMQRIPPSILDLAAFHRRFAMTLAGFDTQREPSDADDMLRDIARSVPDDLLAPFLLIARAAIDGEPCPDDDSLARIYGTRSPGRIRRLLEHLEKSGLIVLRADYGGRRSVGIPGLNLSTAAL